MRAVAIVALITLAACRPELEWGGTTRVDNRVGGDPQTVLRPDGDRVHATQLGRNGAPPVERSGALTDEGRRSIDAALDVLADHWSPPYETRVAADIMYIHSIDADGRFEEVVHEPVSQEYSAEVAPLSDATYAITQQLLGCGGALVVVDELPPECAP